MHNFIFKLIGRQKHVASMIRLIREYLKLRKTILGKKTMRKLSLENLEKTVFEMKIPLSLFLSQLCLLRNINLNPS